MSEEIEKMKMVIIEYRRAMEKNNAKDMANGIITAIIQASTGNTIKEIQAIGKELLIKTIDMYGGRIKANSFSDELDEFMNNAWEKYIVNGMNKA